MRAKKKSKRKRRVRALVQGRLRWSRRGGFREGAGRKPSPDSGVVHATRPKLSRHHPVHITLRVVDDVPSLRKVEPFVTVRGAIRSAQERAGRLGPGFRVVHFTVLSNHLHLVVEADDSLHLTRGMQGLMIRIAKRLNRLWGRSGSLFSDRYHARALASPSEVRDAVAYVLCNARRHGLELPTDRPDPRSSGPWFDGWREPVPPPPLSPSSPVVRAHTWLLDSGWRRLGLVPIAFAPG